MKKFIILNLLIIIVQLCFIIINITPMTIYNKIGEINIISIIIIIVTLFILAFLKNNNILKKFTKFNIFLLMPSFIICLLYDISETSKTEDFNNYLIFDNENIKYEVLEFFPINVEGKVEYYYYFYDICKMPGYGSSYEISLNVNYDNNTYESIKTEVQDNYLYDKVIYEQQISTYVITSNYVENNSSIIMSLIVKLISFNDEQNSITFEYVNINDKIKKEELYFFKKEINLLLY